MEMVLYGERKGECKENFYISPIENQLLLSLSFATCRCSALSKGMVEVSVEYLQCLSVIYVHVQVRCRVHVHCANTRVAKPVWI